MGIALPQWIIEGHNNIWVLGVYGLLFGVALPILVGRWWFGSQARTKDGVRASTAADFFKALKEESDIADVVGALGRAAEWDDAPAGKAAAEQAALDRLEEKIQAELGKGWTDVSRLAEAAGEAHRGRKKALVLLYAHLLRLPLDDAPALAKEQEAVLLQTPTLLNALLSIALARNWLAPTLAAMRLHAFLAQALPPRRGLELAQLPRVGKDEVRVLGAGPEALGAAATKLGEKGDVRAEDVQKALERWPRLELVDAAFKGTCTL
jgi:translocation protein SEC63